MQVKTWQPNPDCKQCAQAEKNYHESNASGERIYTSAIAKVKAQHAEIVALKVLMTELEARIKMMSTVENNLRDGLKQVADQRDTLKTAFDLVFAKGVELQSTLDRVRNLVIEESHESYQTITSKVLAELNAQPEDKS